MVTARPYQLGLYFTTRVAASGQREWEVVASAWNDLVRRLAETWCANCHRVSPTGPGPATDAAPAFAAVAAMPSTTPLALRVFLQTPHRNMPNFQLSREHTDDLIAYIMSLRAR